VQHRPLTFLAGMGLLALAVAGGVWIVALADDAPPAPPSIAAVRGELFRELRPLALRGCTLERFGEAHDGGYLLCGNLLGAVRAGYSYGISGYDGWGCEVSRRLAVPVHQYDCFNLTEPVCGDGRTEFHGECIAERAFVDADGRPFDTLEGQLARTGSAAGAIVVKMDVEGAEWKSLAAASDATLARIDQLVIELHGVDDPAYLALLRRLKRHFHVAHVHFNNYACRDGIAPFPADVYEVLFVSRRLAAPDSSRRAPLPHPLDAPNTATRPDCQTVR
jgi:hypothetical protein